MSTEFRFRPVDEAHIELLKSRLNGTESQWVERKGSRKGDDGEIRAAMVAFANSVMDGEWAVLFLGADNKHGNHPGVLDVDDLQRKVRDIADTKCYPAIHFRAVPFTVTVAGNAVSILAVEIPPSRSRPHFGGMAWVRIGSESVKAPEQVYHDLIASRNDKVRRLQQIRNNIWFTVRSQRGLFYRFEGSIPRHLDAAEALSISIHGTGRHRPVPYDDVKILSLDPNHLEIEIPHEGTEQAHVQKMLKHWLAYHHNPDPNSVDESNEILGQLLPLADEAVQLIAQMGWADPQYPVTRRVFEIFDRHSRTFLEVSGTMAFDPKPLCACKIP